VPEAAAPQITPQIKGIQVTGFISCSRIFQMLSELEAPFIPSSWRASALAAAALAAGVVAADAGGSGL
jgi:uncharacterized oligopeptide transporter (OPT) family protein